MDNLIHMCMDDICVCVRKYTYFIVYVLWKNITSSFSFSYSQCLYFVFLFMPLFTEYFVCVWASLIYSRYVVHCPFTCWLLFTCSHIFKCPIHLLSLSHALRPLRISLSLSLVLGASLYQPFLLLLFIHCLWAYLNELPLNIKSRILTSIKAQMNLHARTHAAKYTFTHSRSFTQYLKSLNVILWVWECKYIWFMRVHHRWESK